MTLNRPAYTIEVENLTSAWTYATTAGDPADPAAPVVLLDNMRHSWTFAEGKIPAELEPASLSFRLGAHTADELPRLSLNDLVRVRCSRPLAGWPADPGALVDYFVLEGRLADPTLELDPHAVRPITANVVLTDLNADLPGRTPQLLEGQPTTSGNERESRSLARVTGFNFIDPTTNVVEMGMDPFGSTDIYPAAPVWLSHETSASLADLIGFRISTVPLPDLDNPENVAHLLFPRGRIIDPGTVPTTAPPGTLHKWSHSIGNAANPVAFFLESARRLLPARSGALRLVWSAGTVSVTADDPSKPLDVAHARAGVVRTPVEARKAREHAVNRLEVEAIGDPMLAPPSGFEQAVVTRTRRAVDEFGTVTRRLVTSLTYWLTNVRNFSNLTGAHVFLLPLLVEAHLPDPPAASTSWGYDGFEVCTWLMSDAELDAQASQWWPAYPTAATRAPGTNLIRQVVVSDPDPSVLVAGPMLAGALVGAEHEITGGRLTIRPQVAPLTLDYNPDAVDLLSPADLTAAGLPWSAIIPSGLGPDLTAEHFRLIGKNL